MSQNTWTAILEHLRATIDPDEYRRYFLGTAQATDSGDQISVWVPTANDGRYIATHYLDRILRELERLNRTNVSVRFVATGYEEDELDDDA